MKSSFLSIHGTNGFHLPHQLETPSNSSSLCFHHSIVLCLSHQLPLPSLKHIPQASSFQINTVFLTSRSTTSAHSSPLSRKRTPSQLDTLPMTNIPEVGQSAMPGHGLPELAPQLQDGLHSLLFGYGASLYHWSWRLVERRFSDVVKMDAGAICMIKLKVYRVYINEISS